MPTAAKPKRTPGAQPPSVLPVPPTAETEVLPWKATRGDRTARVSLAPGALQLAAEATAAAAANGYGYHRAAQAGRDAVLSALSIDIEAADQS